MFCRHQKFSIRYANEFLQETIVNSLVTRLNIPNLFEVFPSFTKKWPGRSRKGWTTTTIKELPNCLEQEFNFKLDKLTPSDEVTAALHDLEEGIVINKYSWMYPVSECTLFSGSFSQQNVPYYSALVRQAELIQKKKEMAAMTEEQYQAALDEKPSDWECLVRKIESAPEGYQESIWGKFPSYLLCIAFRCPSQNQRVEVKQAWKTVFIFLAPEANEKTHFHRLFRQLWMWKCVNPRGRPDNCSRING